MPLHRPACALHACVHCACALHAAYPAHHLHTSRTHLAHISHELGFLLQAHGFLCDTGHFRGMRPTLDPRQLSLPSSLTRLPSPPLSDFVEVSSLEVNYMGWAVKSELAGSGGAAAEVSDPAAATRGGEESPPKEHAPGALAKGLRDFERRS